MNRPLHLFEAYGVELEYMIADRSTLDVRPLSDRVLHAAAGAYESEVEMGPLSWSNELVLHVIELKTNGPAAGLGGLGERFQNDVTRINGILAEHGALLLPSSMHPWMDPLRETRLWPHEYNAVYEAYNRIFDCRGHGWSNLQCTHLNLPFADDAEFGRLHAAIRLVLPILPALAASSPMMGGRRTGLLDTRLEVYRHNAARIPLMTGRVIPEPVYTRAEYEACILNPLYRELAAYDAGGVLQDEWANARGAIARFDRNTIEIRVLDIQECPRADLAVLWLIVAVLRALVEERWSPLEKQCEWPIEPLERFFLATLRDADGAVVEDRDYLGAFGAGDLKRCTAGVLWAHLYEALRGGGANGEVDLAPIDTILREGCLARRLTAALGDEPGERSHVQSVYRRLAACLASGNLFHG